MTKFVLGIIVLLLLILVDAIVRALFSLVPWGGRWVADIVVLLLFMAIFTVFSARHIGRKKDF